ncbi:MAG: transposase [Halobacteriales archaeon]
MWRRERRRVRRGGDAVRTRAGTVFMTQHSDTVRLWQRQLEETYAERSRIETAIGVCKDLGLGTPRVRGRVRVKTHVFIALCLRLAVALANHHRGNDVASPTITL